MTKIRWNTLTAAIILSGLVLSSVPSGWARKSSNHSHRKSLDQQLSLAAKTETPKDQEICFSPDENCDAKLIRLIQSAEKSIDIAIYDLNLESLVHTLLLKSKTIRVRIIADRRQAKGSHSKIPSLIKAGANVRYGKQRGIFHNKFTIVDGKMIQTGSFNYTHHASESNSENQIYLGNPATLKRFQTQFETMWKRASN